MKRFMKTCGIAAFVMILAGIVMTALAGVIKGPEVIASVKTYVGEAVNQLDSGIRFDVNTNMNFDENIPVMEGAASQTFSVSEIQKLDAEIGACQLMILPSEDENIYVQTEGTGTYQGYVSEGTLYLKAISSTNIGASLSKEDNTINLDLQAPDCDIALFIPENFYLEEMKLSLGAGEISGSTAFAAGKLDIELAAGEVTLPNLQVGKLYAEVGAGSLYYKGNIGEAVDVECGMGEIELELEGAATDYNYDVEVAAGEVTVGRESFGGIAGERSVDNNASKNIDVECAMGSVTVTFVNAE